MRPVNLIVRRFASGRTDWSVARLNERMRLWTLHPKHLDPVGLVALWREALLAQAVLGGKTRGYRHHPQLERFARTRDPLAVIGVYLRGIADEADARGYRFNTARIGGDATKVRLRATRGQLAFEWEHLGNKLRNRNPTWFESSHIDVDPVAHPLFRIVDGSVASWERSEVVSLSS